MCEKLESAHKGRRAHIKAFLGALIKQFKHCTTSTLEERGSDTILFHIHLH